MSGTLTDERSGMVNKLKIPLFIALVIVIECGIAVWIFPSAADSSASAEGAASALPEAAAPEHSEDEKEAIAQLEVDLGDFNVTSFQPSSNTTFRIDFHLYGIVDAPAKEEFLNLLEENQHRFRDQVIITIRSAEIADLSDAGLGALKRKILEKTNRLLGKPLMRSVIFSDFLFIEQ
ncbi:MAG: flagellar basal body-associated FliL family protein [Pirellulales bacterium]|nr:flagellar basal body-associated FliL family protein [Pirellulales bacterium]